MFRQSVGKQLSRNNPEFELRGHDVKRIEAFSDAVFAFAVTLLIVSLEVPKSFDELMVTMRGFFAFSVCFILLMVIWYEQNVFFRRYGLHDLTTIILNCILMFLVLFYVYPLKFLFSLIFSNQIYGQGHSPFLMKSENTPELMLIYGIGYMMIYALFMLMYVHALREKVRLKLTPAELHDTRTKLYKNIIMVCVGLLSVILSQALPISYSGFAGYAYILIGPAFSIFYTIRGNQRRSMYKSEDLPGM